ncbi:MAG: c-type cytochrome [Chloroflexi bacterium]|nr:c-type cytochrome [Chloroflexota bacterium]MCI0580702.1 c-type cytochrome [Chloroflexota bacterium]MCI0648567.1 c-type cytochrome [Chloroflexota bacterium]MCI0727330.1 c-type cytochrome [Chloroflexota bacterium]
MSRIRIGIAVITTALTIVVAFNSAGVRTTRAATQAQTAEGQAIYSQRCEICHGAEGDGAGPAAENMDPRPRDFRRGWYKIRTTASGQLPTDEDLVQIISRGMPGTTMPAWEGVLSEAEIQAVAEYIKGFSRRFERETPELVVAGSKVEASQESIARGAELFAGQEAECVKCHGPAGRGDGPSADELTEDSFGDVIVPADLTMPWLFRGGPTVDDIYMRLKTGLTGSPMPAYADVLSDEDIWNLANYVDSLGPDAPVEPAAAITAAAFQGALPTDPNAAAWQEATEYYYPLAGQIMREPRQYTPSVKGVWVQALYNDQELALRLRWHDRFQDAGAGGQPADVLAVQFPAALPEGGERPYFVFGDSANPVNLWLWSALTNSIEERTGHGVDTDAPQASQDVQGTAVFDNGEYILVLRRSLNTGDPEDIHIETGRFVPIAFMAWDGWSGEEGPAGAITSWHLIYLDKPVPLTAYVWVPVAIVATAVVEGWVVWAARRKERIT